MNIRLMSHNVWGMFAPDVVKEVANRCELMAEVYEEYRPDVIGMQEFSEEIRRHRLPELLAADYRELDVSADLKAYGMENLYTPIFYRFDICEPVDAGFVLYDRAYNNHDSKGVTWAVFRSVQSGELFTVCNTHYWWKSGPEHDLARVGNSEVILSLKRKLPEPFFVMGDMNCDVKSEAYRTLLEGGLCDVQSAALDTMDCNTHHAYPEYDSDRQIFFGSPKPTGGYQNSIDHILLDSEHADADRRFLVVTTDEACNTSDHCPIFTDAEF